MASSFFRKREKSFGQAFLHPSFPVVTVRARLRNDYPYRLHAKYGIYGTLLRCTSLRLGHSPMLPIHFPSYHSVASLSLSGSCLMLCFLLADASHDPCII